MWWGQAHELHVQDLDETTGELYTCEIIPNGPPDPERRTFACSWANWKAAMELGRAFGWEPKGAVFCPWWEGESSRDLSYQPDGWLKGLHEVERDDARAWALALRSCVAAVDEGRFSLPKVRQPVLLVGGMSANEYRQANRGLTLQFLVSFAEFMEKGPFRFGWDS